MFAPGDGTGHEDGLDETGRPVRQRRGAERGRGRQHVGQSAISVNFNKTIPKNPNLFCLYPSSTSCNGQLHHVLDPLLDNHQLQLVILNRMQL